MTAAPSPIALVWPLLAGLALGLATVGWAAGQLKRAREPEARLARTLAQAAVPAERRAVVITAPVRPSPGA